MKHNPLVVIHQPDFIPYLGFFHRLLLADVWVVLDHVQINRRGWTHRDKIKTQNGMQWLTIPLQSAPRDSSINAILLANDPSWCQAHLNILEASYKKAPFFAEIFPYCKDLYSHQFYNLSDFSLASVLMLLTLFDIDIVLMKSSDMLPETKSNALMAELVVKAGGNRYLSGLGAKAYFDPAPFDEAGVNVIWQQFEHPVYSQLHGAFVPQLTSLDLLFNCGINDSRKLLRSLVNEPF